MGSHRTYTNEGILRPVVIPTYSELDEDIIRTNMRTDNMTRKKYFALLNQCK